ncbi:hypothetical protein HPP92_026684 [Vanilla planifolia]|uniref:Uncharacterized protein n=1 Tax=Vanilla planifolia TaxID=51239 RepID=A0A835U6U3_VANPL|nr:hypothetical protein HPP92_026904 [Vanilla planifolia]KAG0450562.1 hypothetical protein HPP92_026684 [Vanilla planifolia]
MEKSRLLRNRLSFRTSAHPIEEKEKSNELADLTAKSVAEGGLLWGSNFIHCENVRSV